MIERKYYLDKLAKLKDMNVIKVVTGVRRCGKSTLLKQFRDSLEQSGIPAEQLISYNFEEPENLPQGEELWRAVYDSIKKQLISEKPNYVFLDEIQSIPNFEKLVDGLYVKDNVDLYITGSNAYFLSSDLATMLSGRYVEIALQPLTFSEFMLFFPNGTDKIAAFQQFMRYGGFPEVANFLVSGAESQIPLYLQNVYKTVLEKDIKQRRQIRSGDDFSRVAEFSFDNMGSITSPNKIANTMKSNQITIDKATVSSYLDSMVESFILYRAGRFDVRGKKLLQTMEKYYAVDLGLVNAVLGRPSSADIGKHLENAVYLELLKRYGQVWVGKNDEKEIDFVINNTDGVTEYYQVAQTIASPETAEREIRAFRGTNDNYKRVLLTMDILPSNDNGIEHKNIIDWMLENV